MRTLLLLAALVCVPAAHAQPTFVVTVATKTAAHPYAGQGHPQAYVIDGIEGAELTVQRGQSYIFQMVNVDAFHPFYLSTSATGGGEGVYDDGVTGNFASGNAALTFDVPQDAPDLLWYQCASHAFMGWRINVAGGASADGPPAPAALRLDVSGANPTRDATALTLTLPAAGAVTVEVFDVAGRRVTVLLDGERPAGDTPLAVPTRGWAAGVYVVRATAGGAVAEARVTVVR